MIADRLTREAGRQKYRKRNYLFIDCAARLDQALYTILNTPRPCYSKQHISITWMPVRAARSWPHTRRHESESAFEQDTRNPHTEMPCSVLVATASISRARSLGLKAVNCLTGG